MKGQAARGELEERLSTVVNRHVSRSVRLEVLGAIAKLVNSEGFQFPSDLAHFFQSLGELLLHPSQTLRACTLRVIRYSLNRHPDKTSILTQLITSNVGFMIARSMEREEEFTQERVEAFKLARAFIGLDCSIFPRCIVAAVIAIAETHRDAFCKVSLELLIEIAMSNPKLTAYCGGFATLVTASFDPHHQSYQPHILAALLNILNDESTRAFLRTDCELQSIVSLLTNNDADEPPNRDRCTAATRAIFSMLKSWSGLISFASDATALTSIVQCLLSSHLLIQELVLDSFFQLLFVPNFETTNNSNSSGNVDSSNATAANSTTKASNTNHPNANNNNNNNNISNNAPTTLRRHMASSKDARVADFGIGGELSLPSRTYGERWNLKDNFLAALLSLFIARGLVEALVFLAMQVEKDHPQLSLKATVLLGEILHMSNQLLPPAQCARLQTLPNLISCSVSRAVHPSMRSNASTMVSNLHQFSHNRETSNHYDFHLSLIVTGANKWRRRKGMDKNLDRIDDVKRKIDWSMDENQLTAKLKQTQVLTTKDYTRWDWDVITEALEGPLRNPAHLNYALHTKFIKRIISFLQPTSNKFASIPCSPDAIKYVRAACQLMELLLSTEEGTTFLSESRLISHISDLLKAEVDGNGGAPTPPTSSVFSSSSSSSSSSKRQIDIRPENVHKTLVREYFTLLGTLSSYPNGNDVLKKAKVFAHLGALLSLQGRDDLPFLILSCLDYNLAGYSRVLLQKSLSSSSKVVRYMATRHMRVLLRAGVANFSAWGIEFLVTQLADSNKRVKELALSILDEACDEDECLESLISKKPRSLLDMGAEGKSLVLRFLSREQGLQYLQETGFVASELELWRQTESQNYVMDIEKALDHTFSDAKRVVSQGQKKGVVNPPPHFYGELARTEPGCSVLRESGHIPSMVRRLQSGQGSSLSSRAILWALVLVFLAMLSFLSYILIFFVCSHEHKGHIGSSKTGLKLLEEEKAVNLMVNLAETSPCLSIRGYVIHFLRKHSFRFLCVVNTIVLFF
ncbi:Peptidyl-prolyl cis-trans isomerase fkbp11 [Balamuthia mandrillaris]